MRISDWSSDVCSSDLAARYRRCQSARSRAGTMTSSADRSSGFLPSVIGFVRIESDCPAHIGIERHVGRQYVTKIFINRAIVHAEIPMAQHMGNGGEQIDGLLACKAERSHWATSPVTSR